MYGTEDVMDCILPVAADLNFSAAFRLVTNEFGLDGLLATLGVHFDHNAKIRWLKLLCTHVRIVVPRMAGLRHRKLLAREGFHSFKAIDWCKSP